MDVVTVVRGSDEPIVVPIAEVGPAWSVTAVVREWPGQTPPVHEWSSGSGSAVVEDGQIVLLCDDADSWSWRSGELAVEAAGPDGRIVRGPWRMRVQ